MIRIRSRFIWLVLYGDTTAARFILGMVAALWAILLFLPGDTFERPVYAYMGRIASEHVWASAWLLYAIVLLWRTFSFTAHRTWLTLLINGIGVCLFTGATACIALSKVWPAPAAVSGDIVLSLVAVWMLMRSGLNNPPGWRHD